MGLLDGVLGGAVGAEMATAVNGFITTHGGVQGIVAQMEKQGFGNTVKSWVGTGPTRPSLPTRCMRPSARKSSRTWRQNLA